MTTLPLNDPQLLCSQALVAGQWCDANNGGLCEVRNPATGVLLGTVPDMGACLLYTSRCVSETG